MREARESVTTLDLQSCPSAAAWRSGVSRCSRAEQAGYIASGRDSKHYQVFNRYEHKGLLSLNPHFSKNWTESGFKMHWLYTNVYSWGFFLLLKSKITRRINYLTDKCSYLLHSLWRTSMLLLRSAANKHFTVWRINLSKHLKRFVMLSCCRVGVV